MLSPASCRAFFSWASAARNKSLQDPLEARNCRSLVLRCGQGAAGETERFEVL
jgi:hypothetical protein